jgi:hypothetical protein
MNPPYWSPHPNPTHPSPLSSPEDSLSLQNPFSIMNPSLPLYPPHTWSLTHVPTLLQLSSTTHPPPAPIFPLQEVAGVEGTVRVHVPFSILDISQIKQQLSSISDNPTRYHKELFCLTQAYALTWSDIYNIINDNFMEDKKRKNI